MEEKNVLIQNYIQEHEAELFADLKEIVSYPSVKSAPEPGAPMGRATADCLEACAALFRKYGFDAEVFQESAYALAYYGAKPGECTGYTGIFTHADVVPVIPEDWILTSPFDMLDRGDLVIGRGVNDDKNAVIGALYILRAVRDLQIPLQHPVTVFIGGNEEAGMKDIANFKREYAGRLPSVAIVPDASYPVSFGERGSFHADIRSLTPSEFITDIRGGAAYNIVMGKLTCRLKNLPGLAGYLSSANPGCAVIRDLGEELELTVSGIPCHGSRPHLGESALKRTVDLLCGFDGLPEGDRRTLTELQAMLSDVNGINLGIPDDDPYMGKLTCGNGIVRFPDNCIEFTLDIRFGPGVDKDAAKQTLADNVAARGFAVKTSRGGTSFRIDPESAPAKAFLEAYRRCSGNPEAKFFYMSGGTYSKYLNPECPSFSTGVTYGKYVTRLDLPEGHGKCHEADECLGKPEYIRGLGILGGILTEIDTSY